jgi:hypothetical protein
MKSNKHTGGKWKLIEEQYKLVSEQDDTIASFAYGNHETSLANAKLAVNAPELLEALMECLSDLHYQIESKHGAKAASEYHSIVKAKNIIDKIKK